MARVSSEVRELAREISAVKRGLRDATVTPQLGRSSLDDESINTYDSDGNLRARYGLQHDGTYTAAVLDGPVPPVPSVPTVSGGPGELSVTWDGTYVDDERAPMDFHVVEVWAAENDFSDRSEARLLGHFANESGGDITVARPVGEWHVALVSKAQSGRRSAVSERAVAVVESVVDQGVIDDLNEKLDGLPSVTWSEDPPTAADGDGKPDNAVWRQVDASTDAVIGEWTWDETSSVWVARPIADDAIYSLDVGKLFASQLGVNTVVAEEIWAAKIAASKIDAEEINTQSLGADTGFIGVLNSAEIVGAVIKTAASGARVELDSGHGIRIFNTDGDLVLSADADGNLVTGEGQDSRVTIAPTGIDLSALTAAQLREWPTDGPAFAVAVSGDRVYVTTAYGYSVEVYDLAGVKQTEWTTDGPAFAVAVSGDRVYVTTDASYSVEVYDLAGVKQTEWTTGGFAYGVAVSGDRVYVTTTDAHSVEVYDLAGVKQTEWTTGGFAYGVAVSGDRVYVATSSDRAVEVYSVPGTEHTTASLDSTTGRLAALSADLGGVTRTETLTPRNILPRGRTDNEDYAPTVEIVRPAFTQGLHVFEDTTHRDLELPDPPDGTQAWTGTGNSLKQWTRINGAWEETPTQPAPADHTHSRVETTGTRWVGIAGSNQLSATTYAMAARSGVSEPSTVLSQFPLVVARRDDNNEVRLERLTGTLHADYLPYRIAVGYVLVPSGGANQTSSVTITFPAGLFTSEPRIGFTARTGAPGQIAGVSISGSSAAGVTLNLVRTSNTDTGVDWWAIQA